MKIICHFFICFIALTFCISAQAQHKSFIQLTGRIFDSNGAVIPNIKVEAFSKTKEKFEQRTNEDGVYSLNLPEGIYTLGINRQEVKYNLFEFVKFENYRIVPAYDGKINLDVPLSAIGDGVICSLTVSSSSEKPKESRKHKTIKKRKN